MLKDTSYAIGRRLFFIEKALREMHDEQNLSSLIVADIGCGTGEFLTLPLAIHLGKNVKIYAYEPEDLSFRSLSNSIEKLGLQNIYPIQNKGLLEDKKYDAVIISEVIEHVSEPIKFLVELTQSLNDNGIMIITSPNGYGLFEMERLVFDTLDLVGVIPTLRIIKRSFSPARSKLKSPYSDTLAISPHINFFTLRDFYRILFEAGLSLKKFEGKHLTAGPFSDRIINRSEKLIKLNAYLGEKLPLQFVSGWMVVTEKIKEPKVGSESPSLKSHINIIKRIYSGYKRWMNLKLADRLTRNGDLST